MGARREAATPLRADPGEQYLPWAEAKLPSQNVADADQGSASACGRGVARCTRRAAGTNGTAAIRTVFAKCGGGSHASASNGTGSRRKPASDTGTTSGVGAGVGGKETRTTLLERVTSPRPSVVTQQAAQSVTAQGVTSRLVDRCGPVHATAAMNAEERFGACAIESGNGASAPERPVGSSGSSSTNAPVFDREQRREAGLGLAAQTVASAGRRL